jgi:hypothetical protein
MYKKMNRLRFLAPVGFVAMYAIFGVAVMLLWNLLIPALFGLSAVNYWQALGLLVLCRILFGGFNLPHHRHGRGMHHKQNKFREKWMQMTPEERQKFVNRRKEQYDKGQFWGNPHFDPFATEENTSREDA